VSGDSFEALSETCAADGHLQNSARSLTLSAQLRAHSNKAVQQCQ
jgi:hypothetical protein